MPPKHRTMNPHTNQGGPRHWAQTSIETQTEVHTLRAQKLTMREIAQKLHLSHAQVERILKNGIRDYIAFPDIHEFRTHLNSIKTT